MSGTASNPVTVGCKLPNGVVLRVGEDKAILSGANSSNVIGGYGLSSVPSDLWDAWHAKHKDSDLVKKGLVFAQSTVAKATAQANEQAGIKSGSEPLDPDAPAPGVTKAGSK
ncbi:MAG: hypothetical protein [Caudoviricetes sp.]|nr:MAG: hypothetical protein [Caudoviricetes sp.]